MQKGQTLPLILAGILILIIVSGGAYLFGKNSSKDEAFPKQVACTQDAKICPDGSGVGRMGPNCEFAPCPTPQSKPSSTSDETLTWKTYTSKIYGFSFDYPNSWILKEEIRQDHLNVYLYDETKARRISFIGDLNTPDCDTKTAEREGIKYEYVDFQIGDIMSGNSNFCGKDKYRITLKDKDNNFVVLYFDFVNSPKEEIARSILKSVKGLYSTVVPI